MFCDDVQVEEAIEDFRQIEWWSAPLTDGLQVLVVLVSFFFRVHRISLHRSLSVIEN